MKFDFRKLMIEFAVMFAVGVAIAVVATVLSGILVGCSWSSRTEGRVVERERLSGSIGGVPVDVTRTAEKRSAEESSGEQSLGLEKLAQMGAAIGGEATMFGTGGVGGIAIGLLTTAFMWIRKNRAERQRNELIGGIEASKRILDTGKDKPDENPWLHLTTELEKNQNEDTKKVVASLTN